MKISRAIPFLLLSLFVFWACTESETTETAPQEETEPTDILFLAGARSHASGDHEFFAGCTLLAKALNEQSGLNVRAKVISGWPDDESVFEGVEAVVIYSDGTKVVGEGWDKADALAKTGVGLMFMHYAVHPDIPNGEKYFRPWIGGAFETGYSVNPHWIADLETMPDHPIGNGIAGPVRAYDEFYYNMRFRDDRDSVLDLVTAVPRPDDIKRIINLWTQEGYKGVGKRQTLMWGVEREDGGRGVGFTGGHYHRNWAIDGFRQLVLNAIIWTAGLTVPEQGVVSKPLTVEELNANLDDYEGKENPLIPLPDLAELEALPAAELVDATEHARRQEEAKQRRREAARKAKEKAKR
ncbi:MAG: ThuA domain-containing protein [Verrucomicrobiota bacterium]